ncbi:hypothetical protein IFM89_031439 [Coptis chinensis]|uniref:J domain-containing protein n=1 Tax=Coptis chinensis TaxID=261450 RepID=A0A835HFF0_9MAGN|nr:hypothetical protein IFM89_031439 [Coptis chinensis]
MEVSPTVMACLSVAAAALGGRFMITRFSGPRIRNFYGGGFQQVMTMVEARRILNVRGSADTEKIKEAYKKVMRLNHPDVGGSHYLTRKINEAKDILLGKTSRSGSAF